MANSITKIFSALTSVTSSGRFPVRSNILNGSSYSAIGGSNKYGSDVESNQSTTTGNSTTDNNLSTYYSKMTEIKTYERSDLSEMITNLFRDYVINFMNKSGSIITLKNLDGSVNESKTERINKCLQSDLKIQEVIKSHLSEIIYYSGYHFLIHQTRDDTGHVVLNKRDLYDPVTVVTKTKDYSEIKYICRGDDGNIYEVPYEKMMKICINPIRLRNDMDKMSVNKVYNGPGLDKDRPNIDKISSDTFYTASMPMYYSITHKVKEYLLKDVIVSLLSIKDLVQPILLMIHMDKGTSIEAANDLTKKAEAMINNYTDLSAITSSQFGINDIIDSLLNNVRVLPDYNSSMTNMGTVELNKINQKIQEMRMELDSCKDSVLTSVGIPLELAQGRASKWEVLKMSERLNSRINAIISGIKSSIVDIVNVISLNLYNEQIDFNQVEVHLFSKTTIEYNNQMNTAESISNLVQQISAVVEMALRTLEVAGPFFNTEGYLNYVTTILKNIDPEIESFSSVEEVQAYAEYYKQKMGLGEGNEY